MKLLNWIGNHPFLTFFMGLILHDIIIGSLKIILGHT